MMARKTPRIQYTKISLTEFDPMLPVVVVMEMGDSRHTIFDNLSVMGHLGSKMGNGFYEGVNIKVTNYTTFLDYLAAEYEQTGGPGVDDRSTYFYNAYVDSVWVEMERAAFCAYLADPECDAVNLNSILEITNIVKPQTIRIMDFFID